MDSRPNIIMVLTDQQRVDTIRAWGYAHMSTPGLDRLAGNGVNFTSCYACGATCISARAALFTGLYPHTTGVYSFFPWAHHRSVVQDLAENGYHCVNIGKMHHSPRDVAQGFHERVVVENPTMDVMASIGVEDAWGRHLSMYGVARPLHRHRTDPDWRRKFQAVPWDGAESLHSDVFIGESARAWVRRHRPTKPVFLEVGFTGPHEPYDPLPRHLAQYRGVAVPAPRMRPGELERKPPQHRMHGRFNAAYDHECQIELEAASPEDLLTMRRHYYAKVSTVDEQIEALLADLGDAGYLDHALVLFTSDHGDLLGDHGLPYKWLMYEPVLHVPLILWDTRCGSGGRTDAGLASHIDLAPTLLEAAGVPLPQYWEGRSLLAAARGGVREPPPAVFAEDNYQTMIRASQHKLVHYAGQEEDGELYDLAADPDEFDNRYADPAFREIRTRLEIQLMHWLTRSTYRAAGYGVRDARVPTLWPDKNKFLHPDHANCRFKPAVHHSAPAHPDAG